MSLDKIDAVIVGGGLAGLTAAYRLASAGKQVILLERGDTCGSKNVTGGRIYVDPIRAFLPDIIDEAPFERHVVREMITVLDEESGLTMDYSHRKWRTAPFMSYTVLRAKFDNWLAEKVMEKGAFVITKRRVDDLIWEDGRIAGVVAGGEEIPAHVVIAADGALSFMAEKAGLRKPLTPENYAVAVKEVWKVEPKAIEERFGVAEGEGAAGLFIGSVTQGLFGGGFLYTNSDSISLGLVVGMKALMDARPQIEVCRLMEAFEARPEVGRWIEGGELREYSAHIISEAGIGGISGLCDDGMLIVGDAAGFALNMGITVRGMEFAIASGAVAAQVAIRALDKGDTSRAELANYERLLRETFVLKDMETFRASSGVLDNPRLFTVYPKFICNLMEALFTIDAGPRKSLYASAKEVASRYVLNWEGVKDVLSFRKM